MTHHLPRLEEYLLRQILGIRFIADPVESVPIHSVDVHVVAPSKGIGILGDRLVDQDDFICRLPF